MHKTDFEGIHSNRTQTHTHFVSITYTRQVRRNSRYHSQEPHLLAIGHRVEGRGGEADGQLGLCSACRYPK